MSKLKKLLKYLVLLVIGGIIYYGIELVYRGYSHWTMMLVGGIAFICIGEINEFLDWDTPLIKQSVLGGAIVTVIEFVAGCIINLWCNLNVWDYSHLPFNILGQVCLIYTVMWMGLSAVAIIADDWLRHWLFKEERPHYVIF